MEEAMSGEDKALAFFGDSSVSLSVFETLKRYIGEFCPQARIMIQDSLLAFRTNAGFAYVSKTAEEGTLFDLALTSRKKINSDKISKTVQPIPGTPSYIYHIAIRDENDLDSEVRGWIRQSYEYSKLSLA